MPLKDPEKRRAYQRRWKLKRRNAWLEEHGPCAECGSSADLEVDHIDPLTKVHHNVWSWSQARRDAELAKCQVLCRACHEAKTMGARNAPAHGTNSRYTCRLRCRCDACRAAHAEANNSYR